MRVVKLTRGAMSKEEVVTLRQFLIADWSEISAQQLELRRRASKKFLELSLA